MHWPLRCTSAPTMKTSTTTKKPANKSSTKRTVKTPKASMPRMSTVKAKAKKAIKKVARKISKK